MASVAGMETDLLKYVLAGLERTRGTWREVSRGSGVPYDTITKIAQRQIEDPKVSKVQRLADYFRSQEAAA